MTEQKIKGVLSPVLTPFRSDYSIHETLFLQHCKKLIESDVGLAVFGTNSEGTSLTIKEKRKLLDVLVAADISAKKIMPGVGSCTIGDTVEITRHATELGCAGVLALPPFYYKGVSEEGLYRYFSSLIEQVGRSEVRVYLYHIPPVSQVGISISLIERLLRAFPEQIAGIKDSSGDWQNTLTLLEKFQPEGFDVFAGSETFLLDILRYKGAGCITATGNVNAVAINRLYDTWQTESAEKQQERLNEVRSWFQQFPMIAAMKSALAVYHGESDWKRLRPPLVELSDEQSHQLKEILTQNQFVPNEAS